MSAQVRLGVRGKLTGPGGPFEFAEEDVLGERMRVFKNRARSLRDLLRASAAHADKEYLVHGEKREVTVDARRNSDAVSAPFTLTATILGATVSPNPDVIPAAASGVPVARSYTITNLYGAFTGRAQGTALGSAFLATPSIAHHAQQTFDVTVAAGSTSLRATIGSPSDPAADLDLFVYNCTSGTCLLAGQNADGDSEESVTIANPTPGLWRVLVDGYSIPAGTTTYNYVDVFANPAYGSVSVTDANALRPAGASWTVPGSVTANASPTAGRVLLGNDEVRTDANVLVGIGSVIVESVTP